MIWLQTTLDRRAREWGADVLLAALTIGPVRATLPFVSVVHDLTPWTHPEWHRWRTVVGFVPLWERTAGAGLPPSLRLRGDGAGT